MKAKKIALAVSLAFSIGQAHAVLERAGPVGTAPSVGGFPSWYQDTTGVALEFCDPQTQSELDGGWCLLLPGDAPAVPEVFPNLFGDEHFYWAGTAAAPTADGSRALLVLAQEAAFAVGAARPGDQIVFARIRMVLNPVPVTGTYRIIHPFGEDLVDAVAGGKIFYTEDIGIGAPGDFNGSLASRLGPFLMPSATPGGAEMPPLTAANPEPDTDPAHFGGAFVATPYPGTGKAYIADPSRIGPVTGSALPDFVDSTGATRNHNIFRIEGPAGAALGIDPVTGISVDWVETTDFSLMGRLYTGSLPSRINVERASYAATTGGQQKVAVFATASDTTQARLPAQPRPAGVAPQLTYFDAPCAGTVDPVTGEVLPPFSAPAGATEVQMFAIAPGLHSGQNEPVVLPTGVCVRDSAARDAQGNIVALFVPRVVTDEVTVSSAVYDHSAGTLTVAASSSDEVNPPVLRLTFGTFIGDLVGGTIQVPGLIATPASVRVSSSALGSDQAQVKTTFAAAPPPAIPVAANDAFSFNEDGGVQILPVLANDANVTGGAVSITAVPRLGAATVNLDGTVSFTPNLNANGTDQFTYTVTAGTQVSNTATVTLTINPVNDAPVAVNDSANAVRNWPRNVKVTANDTDPDGATDIAGAILVTGPAAGSTVSGVTCGAGGICSFTPSATASSVTFTYRAVDSAGVESANTATATVTVAAAEQVGFNRAEYTRASSRLRVIGTVTPAMGQTLDLQFINSSGIVVGNIATGVAVDATGNWTFDQSPIALPTGAVSVRATTHNSDNANSTVRNQSLSIK
ncbi:MAG TPA: cadherin-like domain-containing protein [Burkholderiales bacterium]